VDRPLKKTRGTAQQWIWGQVSGRDITL